MPPKRKPKSSSDNKSPQVVVSQDSFDIDLIDKLANKGASVRDENNVPSLSSSLQEKKQWTAEQITLLGSRYEKFREDVFELCSDEEYRLWLQTTTQKELAEEWGVSQAYISKTFGSLQKDLKEEVRKNIVALIDKGKSIRSIAEVTGESKSKIQRIASSLEGVSQNIPDNKMGHLEESREKKRQQYDKKDKAELVELLIKRDEVIGNLKKKLKQLS